MKLQQVMEKGLTFEQLYNCDETGLYHRMMPAKTLPSKGAEGMKKQKDRVTLVACSSATGNDINKSALPIHYCGQKKTLMNSGIFSDWFNTTFVLSVEEHLHDKNLPAKAILLLDNAPSHPFADVLQSSDKSVTTAYIPAYTTSLIGPMNQGVLEMLKRHYKRELL